jgi:hypothetical protein
MIFNAHRQPMRVVHEKDLIRSLPGDNLSTYLRKHFKRENKTTTKESPLYSIHTIQYVCTPYGVLYSTTATDTCDKHYEVVMLFWRVFEVGHRWMSRLFSEMEPTNQA